MQELEAALRHQGLELLRHGPRVGVAHGDGDEGAGGRCRLQVSRDVLRDEAGVVVVVEGVGCDDYLGGL